jgi:transmembrane sensor
VILVIVGSWISWSVWFNRHTYHTEFGEQRSLRLSDGSVVTLNSRSQVRIELNQSSRTVELVEGEALFRIARDPVRPFVVRAGGTAIRAIGTAFDVNRKSRGTVVTVVEGRVAVLAVSASSRSSRFAAGSSAPSLSRSRPDSAERTPRSHSSGPGTSHRTDADAAEGSVLLSAGEQIDVTTGAGTASPTRANVSSTTAWMQGRVILRSATLEDVAEEFNRYSPRPLVTEDHGRPLLRLSGVFSTDPQFLIRYLSERPDIEVHETARAIRIIRAGVN